MSDNPCDKPRCEKVGTQEVHDGNKSHIAKHEQELSLQLSGMDIYKIKRTFDLKTKVFESSKPSGLISSGGTVIACGEETINSSIVPSLSETITGTSASILYCDIINNVFLVEEQTASSTLSHTVQNPFVYVSNNGATAKSVAYFPKQSIVNNKRYYLKIKGATVFEHKVDEKTYSMEITPIVWPVPSSKAAFFLGAPEYDWMNITGFYNYNDPKDLGFAPCVDVVSGGGEGLLTGYEKAFADGGKDFFYPQWVRDRFLVGSEIHNFWKFEAEKRFYNRLGGIVDKELCGAAYKMNYDMPITVSNDFCGNYLKDGDKEFYSFIVKSIDKVIVSLGSEEIKKSFSDFLKEKEREADMYHPIAFL